ncbi:hypothetical protein [Haladaptatus salinisoli]|uniref:hypothetical protein n=1 Tax=Haladaptatus salinisoli TaxID=2884876 RepID=UPI001D0A8475|nr:hypothetical protein [Haladaptatus salinisoli]
MSQTTTEDGESIVLEIPRGYAQIGDPTDPAGQQVIDLRDVPTVDGAKHLELPVDSVDVARGLLQEHHPFSVVSDPTDYDLASVKSKVDLRKEKQARRAREMDQKREKKNRGFDPVTDQPSNHRKVKIKKVYNQLVELGEDEKAEKLREISSTPKQNQVARQYAESIDGVAKR